MPWRDAIAADDGWRTFEVTTRIQILQPKGVSRVWLPVPTVDATDWQKVVGNTWSGNAEKGQLLSDGKYGVGMFYAEWSEREPAPLVELTNRFMTRNRAMDLSRPNPKAERLSASESTFYTSPTELIPTDGIVKEKSREITKGLKGDIEKARAIYEWVVENTYRDPKTRGCGWGDIKSMLETSYLGGKCGDLNAMFVGLARAAGVPARDVYGIRVAPSALGYKSLGANTENINKGQHCRAEFFAQSHGWVPVDPGDVRKVILEEPPGNLPITHERVAAARKRLFGSWEMNWLAFNMGHDVKLPNAPSPKLPYLMYPNGETGGQMLDQLEPDPFKYTIIWREVKA
jgi:transglutaminase-like putative cysteine protease